MQEPPSPRTWLYADMLCRKASNLYFSENKRVEDLSSILDNLLNASIRPANIPSKGVCSLKP
jgi:hypothetical protein